MRTKAKVAPAGASVSWRRRKDRRKPEILEAARSILEDGGYEGSFVSDVASRAGVSEATVYKYFDNKHDLVSQVIGAWLEKSLDQMTIEIAALDSARARLQLVATRHLSEMEKSPGLHRLIYSVLRWNNYRGSVLHRLNQRYGRIVQFIFVQGANTGEFDKMIDPQLSRDMLFGSLEHSGWRIVYDEHPGDIGKVASNIVDQLIHGLVSRQAGETADDAASQSLVQRLEQVVIALEAQESKRRQPREHR